jgi:hypothetical protein
VTHQSEEPIERNSALPRPQEIRSSLGNTGYFVTRVPVPIEEAIPLVLGVGRSLGDLYLPPDCDPGEPVLRTAPTRARRAAPFDRPEPIGWHGDFATHQDRPELSIVYITRPDPRGGDHGAWRLATVARVLDVLQSTTSGRGAFDLLSRDELPFSYADGEPLSWYRVIESRPEGLGLRFYLPSIRRGCLAAYGELPLPIASALDTLERAADQVEVVIPTHQGSMLVISNWFALHDRVRQTISRTRANREALLCFVARRTA